MKLKLIKCFCLVLVFCFTANNPILAQGVDSQFNFDEEYEGDDLTDEKNIVYDPLEKVNRKVFAFNEAVDKNIFLPFVRQYKRFIPKPVRRSVHNFTSNISAPFSVLNSALQGDGANAMASFSSFLINSTIGIGGLFDVAGSKKIKFNEEDFGQTFGKYGVGSGPYLVIPFLGPSNLRDATGMVTKQLVDPLSLNAFEVGGDKDLISDQVALSLSAISVIDSRERLISVVDDVRKDSFDVYATMRSAFLQRREALILNR